MRSLVGLVIATMLAAVAALLPAAPRTPVTIKFRQDPFVVRSHAKVESGGENNGSVVLALCRGIMAALCAIPDGMLRATGYGSALQAGHLVPLKGEMAKKQADLSKLLGELEAGQKEMESGPLTPARGEELDRKVQEAEALQAELDRHARFARLSGKSREIVDPAIPGGKKGARHAGDQLATTPGHLFVGSDAYKRYIDGGKEGWSGKVDVKSLRGGRVMLSGEEAQSQAKAFDAGDLPDLGDDALIQPFRDNELVRFAEPERRTLRSLLTVIPVTTDSVRYVKHVSTGRAAASQASRGALKPFLTLAFEPETAEVETIAVLSKVTEQDIEDAPRLISIINDEMRLDVEVEEERQIAWGSGASGQIEGFFTAGITEFDRAAVGDTLIDTIRRIRTNLVMARVMPDGVAAHPLDWEEIELEKGSDSRYVWAVIQTVQGARIWSMPVVETMGMENPLTGARRLAVADWKRAITLYDRNDVRLAVGYMDDDFGRNLRTLRAEERLALAVKRAYAAEYIEVQAAS